MNELGNRALSCAAPDGLEFLFTCGEMGAKVRAFDWSSTPLGPPQQWPECLLVAAGICLSSRFPTHLWWGPDLTLLYNDGYIPFLGPSRHPVMLGRSAREAWADIWERIGPMASGVLATGRPSWAEDVPAWLAGSEAPAHVRIGFSMSPVFGREGTVAGLFCSCIENSEIIEARALIERSAALEEMVRDAQRSAREVDVLREADRQKDEFLATLAHELRNPLAPIRNAVHIMRLRSSSDPELINARDIIERQTEQLVHLVDDLLEVSRIRRGRVHLQLQRVDLATAIGTAVEASRSLIDAAGHTLILQLPEQAIYVEGDPTRLSQIFANLLNNAAKYTPSRGCIELCAQPDGMNVAVRVTDTGIGIPKNMLKRIFDMFAQVDASLERTQGGLGIGLTVAQQLVLLHGGRIEANSEGERRGSTFTVHLPLLPSREEEAGTGAVTSGPLSQRSVPRKVLIADDNADAAESLSILLQMGGHEVRTANDGLAAVTVTEQFHPDVVLLDIGMPELNGYEAAARIRALPHGQHILLLALTGWGQDADRQRAEEAGFDYHLIKPADPGQLERILADTSVGEKPPAA
jgi:signal transduction histidine kinase/ActR/RegA family two-component response regulator